MIFLLDEYHSQSWNINNLIYLKGDVTIETEEDAYRYQIKIEESFQTQLGFRLKTGDIIFTHFDANLTNNNKKQKGRRRSKIFERYAILYPFSIQYWLICIYH